LNGFLAKHKNIRRVKKLKNLNEKNLLRLATTVFIVCMFFSVFPTLPGSNNASAADYGDLMQYEWSASNSYGNGPARCNFGTGPAPDSFDISWKWVSLGSGTLRNCFGGYVFVSNTTGTYALDPNTGAVVYGIPGISGDTIKIDGTYMIIARNCYRIADGSLVWADSTWANWNGTILNLTYDPANKLMWSADNTMWSFSNPSKPPTLAWNRSDLIDGWIQFYACSTIADGKVFLKKPGLEVKCLDEFTGQLLWRTNVEGDMEHLALYIDGKWIGGSMTGDLIALDGQTGKPVWKFNDNQYWNVWGERPAAAYGIYYQSNFDGNLYAINVTNGNVIWKYKCPGTFYPPGPTVADGKVYLATGSGAFRDVATGIRGRDESVCLNAYTGEVIFRVEMEIRYFQAAYGNVYFALAQQNQNPTSYHGHTGFTPGEVWCISGKPSNWAMYGKTPSNSFIGAGPTNLQLKWKVKTGGAVCSSPAVVDGVLYAGSYDDNIYAFDAYSGAKKWEFKTGYQVKAGVAVVNGKVYTGIDDGYAYCINAATGQQVWKTFVTSKTTYMSPNFGEQTRSSPKVVNNKVYIGSIDKNFYILDANTGQILNTFNAGGAILCSPAVVDGAVYFYANKPGANAIYYKIDANTAAVIWQFNLPYLRTGGSKTTGDGGGEIGNAPNVVKGAIYQAWDGGSPTEHSGGLYKINATTGAIIWNAETYWTRDTIWPMASMVYYEGVAYYENTLPNATDPEGIPISFKNRNLNFNYAAVQKQDIVLCNDLFYRAIALNATDGTRLWQTYLARETYGFSVSDPGNFYATCNAEVIYNLDIYDGSKKSYVEPTSVSWTTPVLYDGRLYVGNLDFSIECYGEESSSRTTYYGAQAAITSLPSAAQNELITSAPIVTQSPSPIVTESPIPASTENPTFGLSAETMYAIVAVVVIVIVVAAAALVLKQRKK
jgi:outer membrane protein assembly factor BamB